MVYRDLLLAQGRSFKTNKDYLAAASQFTKWCWLMRYHQENPFEDVKLRSQDTSGDDSPRLRRPKSLYHFTTTAQQLK